MENLTRIMELASIISENTANINKHLILNNLPTPSFDADFPVATMMNLSIAEARDNLLGAMDKLTSLIQGPARMVMSTVNLPSVKLIQRFKLASAFEKEATFAEIAETSGLAEDQVKRIIRYGVSCRIFQEPKKGFVAHTAASKLMKDDPIISDTIGMFADELWPASTRIADAISKWVILAWNISNDTNENLFAELAKFPQREKRFANSMTWLSNGPGYELSHVVDSFNWANFENGTVVDLGGSYGQASCSIAAKFPSLEFVVQDLPGVVKEGRAKLISKMSDRIAFMNHDFFTEQPINGASVYFMRQILHDWSDSYAIRILKALVPALKSGSRVLINEQILLQPGTIPIYKDRTFRNFDFNMWQLTNGKKRDMDDWVKLLKDSDERYTILNVKQPAGSSMSLIEVGWDSLKAVWQETASSSLS